MARTRAAWGRLSIGAKLALRYALAASFTISVFAGIVYSEVARRINRDATLLLETQVRDLVDAYQSQSREHPREHVLAWFRAHTQQMLRHADPELSLGVELLDAEGGVVLAAGSLAGGRLPPPAPAAPNDPPRVRAVNLGGEFAHLVAAAPVDAGVLRIAIGTQRYAENVRHFRGVFALTLPVVFALTGVIGWLLAQRSLRPLQEINRSARRIGAATLDEQIPTTGTGDELDQLASTLNEMTSRIRAGVERMRRFTANAAHQLRTPVTAIRNQIEVTLEQKRDAGEYQRVLEDVLRESQRMSEGITAMLQLARSEAGLDPARLAPHSIRKLLEDVIEFFAPLAQEQGIDLHAGTVTDAQVVGDASWLVQLFSNLVANGIQYTPAGGRVEVTAQRRGQQIEVRVQDSGPGIPEEQRGRVFERFQRGPNGQAGPGFGLGLAIAQEIARAHRGGIHVESRPGAGASFVVELPTAAEPARR